MGVGGGQCYRAEPLFGQDALAREGVLEGVFGAVVQVEPAARSRAHDAAGGGPREVRAVADHHRAPRSFKLHAPLVTVVGAGKRDPAHVRHAQGGVARDVAGDHQLRRQAARGMDAAGAVEGDTARRRQRDELSFCAEDAAVEYDVRWIKDCGHGAEAAVAHDHDLAAVFHARAAGVGGAVTRIHHALAADQHAARRAARAVGQVGDHKAVSTVADIDAGVAKQIGVAIGRERAGEVTFDRGVLGAREEIRRGGKIQRVSQSRAAELQ